MDKIKVQFIGIKNIPNKKDNEILRVRKVKWLASGEGYTSDEYLSFHDYNIVFMNYPIRYPYPSEITEFVDYVSSGGMVVIFLGPSDGYPWWNGFLKISTGKGDSITPNKDHWLKDILRKYDFVWYCLIAPSKDFQELESILSFESVGTAVSGKCVSSVIHFGKGKLILLPIIEEVPKDLIRELIDGIKKN